MSFLSALFGKQQSPASAEASTPVVPQGWCIADGELERLQTQLANETLISLKREKDEMDDTDVLTLTITASEYECSDLETAPILVFRARRVGFSHIMESYIFFEDKFFWGRGQNPTIRVRFDTAPPVTLQDSEFEYGTTKASIHFSKLSTFQNVIGKDRLLFQLLPERGHKLLAKFELADKKVGISGFAEAVLGPDPQAIAAINCEVMDHILRCGPQNILLKKKALAALGYDPGPVDYSKGGPFFVAADRFARARQAYEIVGAVYEGVPRTSWSSALYQEAPSKIKAQIGPLRIFD